LGAELVVQPDSSRKEGPALFLSFTPGVKQPVAQGAAQSCQCPAWQYVEGALQMYNIHIYIYVYIYIYIYIDLIIVMNVCDYSKIIEFITYKIHIIL